MTSKDIWTQLGASLDADEQTRQKLSQALGECQNASNAKDAEIADLKKQLEESQPPVPTTARVGIASHQCTYRTTGSIYSNDAFCDEAADHMHPDFMRDMLTAGSNSQWAVQLKIMQSHFVKHRKHHLTIGKWSLIDGYDWIKAQLRLIECADMLEGVAGVNEPDDSDNGGVNFDVNKLAAHQKRLYEAMKKDPRLAGIPVSNGPIRGENATWAATNKKVVDACRPYMDEFNFHWYPAAGNLGITDAQIEAEFVEKLGQIRGLMGWAGPIIITECGATSDNVGEIRQATIGAKLLQLGQKHNVKVVIYELIDDPGPGVQQNFGAFEANGTPKPLANAIANR